MNKEEIQNIYDYSKSKIEICKKLGIELNQNGITLDNRILKYFSQIGINSREEISKKKLSKHWLEIQKRDYELNPKYCEYCGNKLPFEKRFTKCCNQSCGSALGNKKKGLRSEETKQKISQSLYKGVYIHKNICKWCGKEFETIKDTKYCSEECKQKSISNQMSLLRKKEIEAGTFQGWKSRNILSYPEKFWVNVLQNNLIDYKSNFSIKQENGINNWFLDFYIEINNRKIDLEIDGKQHKYTDRQKSDIKRDIYIKSKGIEVYRIEWNEINSDKGKLLMKEKIDNFLNYIKAY
jgi:very-short-patch-repair endonuclease